MKSVTVAGIDCGTNSIRLKVSRVSEDGVEDIVSPMRHWNVPTPLPANSPRC